jgi:hypothetical protein
MGVSSKIWGAVAIFFCRSELARDGPKDTAGSQAYSVIVDDHREQARSYTQKINPQDRIKVASEWR